MNTTKLGLKKPEGTDLVNIQDLNENVDVIEQQLEQRPIKTGDASNMTTSFTQANAVGNIASGEAIKTSFGKIAKTIADYVSHKATTATTSILGHVKFGTAAGTACQGNDSRLSDSRIPKSHAVTTTTYGIGTASNYGHVKLSDTYNSTVTNGAAANGMAASQKAVSDFYNQINSNLTWKTYNDVTQLGLTASTCTTDQIINALKARKPAALSAPMLVDDYPKVNFASTGKRHLYSVSMSAEGYVSLQDHNLSNNALYYCSHDGTNYSRWRDVRDAIRLRLHGSAGMGPVYISKDLFVDGAVFLIEITISGQARGSVLVRANTKRAQTHNIIYGNGDLNSFYLEVTTDGAVRYLNCRSFNGDGTISWINPYYGFDVYVLGYPD